VTKVKLDEVVRAVVEKVERERQGGAA
jgi:hypothetical protein